MSFKEILQNELGETRVLETISNATISPLLSGETLYTYTAETQDELIKAIKLARENSIPFLVLGQGTGVILPQRLYQGFIIKNHTHAFEFRSVKGRVQNGKVVYSKVHAIAESGTPLSLFIRQALDEGYGGFEQFVGLPGSVGGALMLDAGWGSANIYLSDLLISITYLNKQNEMVTKHVFKSAEPLGKRLFHEGAILLSATFELSALDKSLLWQTGNAALAFRQKVQPFDRPSLGPLFEDLSIADAMRLGTPNGTREPAYLIQQLPVLTGLGLFEKNPNFFVGKSDDIVGVIKKVKREVKKQFGVTLIEKVTVLV